MTDTKRWIDDVRRVEPPDLWSDVEQRAFFLGSPDESHRRRPARTLVILIVATAVVGGSLFALRELGTRRKSHPVASEQSEGYDIQIANLTPETERIVIVEAEIQWASAVFPGARDCQFDVLDDAGQVIGSNHHIFELTRDRLEGQFSMEIQIQGKPASVATSCGPRLDVGTPYAYAITGLHIAVNDSTGVPRLQFSAAWEGPKTPGVVWCRYVVLDPTGAIVAVHESSLGPFSTAPSSFGAGYPTDVPFEAADVQGEIGGSSTKLTPVIDCVPYLGGGEVLPPLPKGGTVNPARPSPLSTNEQSASSGYVFDRVTIRPETDRWLVEWDIRWASQEFPGVRTCKWTVYGEGDSELASDSTELEYLQPKVGGLSILASAEPVRFEGSCGPRLDIPAAYVISNVDIIGSQVRFHMEWPGGIHDGDQPSTNQCIVATFDDIGGLLDVAPFTISAPPGNYERPISPEEQAAATSAVVQCETFNGDMPGMVDAFRSKYGSS